MKWSIYPLFKIFGQIYCRTILPIYLLYIIFQLSTIVHPYKEFIRFGISLLIINSCRQYNTAVFPTREAKMLKHKISW